MNEWKCQSTTVTERLLVFFLQKRLDESLRELLETFRLPGESQQIERIMELFAATYFATKPKEMASQDAAFILGYAVVMLNTDQHNRVVKGRMSLEQFSKNLRGVNNGKDFPPEYLSDVYEAIRKREIVLPQEHEGQLGFNFAWKELLHRAETAGPLVISNTSMYDKELFISSWKPVMSAISFGRCSELLYAENIVFTSQCQNPSTLPTFARSGSF